MTDILRVRQQAAEERFLASRQNDRQDLAWLITGPGGIGKFQLALRLSAWLLTESGQCATTIDIDEDHPVWQRIRQGSEPNLRVVTRSESSRTGARKSHIQVDEIRGLQEHFRLASPSSKPRVAIIDSADDLNVNAANALLKILEEPPVNSCFFLTSNMPTSLLATIRSRCRMLRCQPVGSAETVAAIGQLDDASDHDRTGLGVLAAGSPGNAMRYHATEGVKIYRLVTGLVGDCADIPERKMLKITEMCEADGTRETYEVVQELFLILVTRLARTSAAGVLRDEVYAGENAILGRFTNDMRAGSAWAALHAELTMLLAAARRSQFGMFEVVNLAGNRIAETACRYRR